jgi:hypothetical protein
VPCVVIAIIKVVRCCLWPWSLAFKSDWLHVRFLDGKVTHQRSVCSTLFFSLVIISPSFLHSYLVEASWNVMAHARKPDFVFQRNGRVHLNRFGRLLCSWSVRISGSNAGYTMFRGSVVWRVLATQSIRQFPLHIPFRLSPCAIIFQLESAASSSAWQLWGSTFSHLWSLNCWLHLWLGMWLVIE